MSDNSNTTPDATDNVVKLPDYRTPNERADKRGVPYAPRTAVGVPVVLGEHNDRVYIAVPSWERVALHPTHDGANLKVLQDAARQGTPLEVGIALGKPIPGTDNFRPYFVARINTLEEEGA